MHKQKSWCVIETIDGFVTFLTIGACSRSPRSYIVLESTRNAQARYLEGYWPQQRVCPIIVLYRKVEEADTIRSDIINAHDLFSKLLYYGLPYEYDLYLQPYICANNWLWAIALSG